MNPYRAIEGKMPTKKELSSWTPDRWMDMLRFAEFFLEKAQYKGESYKITDEKRQQLELWIQDNHIWSEFIYRIAQWSDKTTNRQFFYKLNSFMKICLMYLKRHPGTVTEEMAAKIREHPERFGWCLIQYKVTEANGVAIVQRDTRVLSANENQEMKLPSVQAQLLSIQTKLLDIYSDMLNSIKDSDIKKLDINKKLAHLEKMHSIITNKAKTTNHFTQVNLNTKSARDLEQSLLDFSKKRTE